MILDIEKKKWDADVKTYSKNGNMGHGDITILK